MAEKKDFIQGRKPVTFVDLFAGAGGISEGFMQAYTDHNYYDFVLASDINENCELTHRVRYNEQLGLGTKFITEDIMSPTFLPHLLKALNGKEVDVVTGGPSCQSFSLSGRRKRFDKRDGLFNHYLKVIRVLRPSGWYLDQRFDHRECPKGYHMYEFREDTDDEWGYIAFIEPHVWVNHSGTFVTRTKIPFNENGNCNYFRIRYGHYQ